MTRFVMRESLSWKGERRCSWTDGSADFAKGTITRTVVYASESGYDDDVEYSFEEDSE